MSNAEPPAAMRAREARPFGPIDRSIAAIAAISRVGGVVAVALLLGAVLVICQMVFMRYVLQASTVWQHEFVTFNLIGATFIGAPYVLLTHGHVNVDLVPLYLGPRGRLVLAIVASLVTLGFCAVLTGYGAAFWYKAWANDWHAESVWRPPLWIPYFALPLGMGLLTLQALAGLLALVTGRQAPFEAPEASGPT